MPGMTDRINAALGDRVEENVVLSPYTSFGIGGAARYFYVAKTTSGLVRAVRAARADDMRFFVLGGGSNILFDDAGFSGLVIKDNTDKFRINGGIVSALSGTLVDRLVDATVERGLAGMEYAAGIMGTIGGAVHGNAGAFGHAINEILESAVMLSDDDRIEVVDNDFFRFAYRSSKITLTGDTVLSVRLRLKSEDKRQLTEIVKDRRKFRQERHPVDMGCAGSVFKNIRSLENPGKVTPAGKLLEESGVRGMNVGGAAVFEKHCNIIVNQGQATSEDVRRLVEKMRNAVSDNFGIDLEMEILYIKP